MVLVLFTLLIACRGEFEVVEIEDKKNALITATVKSLEKSLENDLETKPFIESDEIKNKLIPICTTSDLITILLDSKSYRLRSTIIDILANELNMQLSKEDVNRLIETFKLEKPHQTRLAYKVSFILSKNKPFGIPALKEAMKNKENNFIYTNTLRALHDHKINLPDFDQDQIRKELLLCLTHNDDTARLANNSLVPLKENDLLQLLEWMETYKDENFWRYACNALANSNFKSDQISGTLRAIALSAFKNKRLRGASMNLLAKLGYKKSDLSLYKTFLQSAMRDGKRMFYDELSSYNQRWSVDLLIAGLDDNNSWVRGTCAFSLEKLKAKEALPKLIYHLENGLKLDTKDFINGWYRDLAESTAKIAQQKYDFEVHTACAGVGKGVYQIDRIDVYKSEMAKLIRWWKSKEKFNP